jgi:hypothetical protein
MSVDDPTATLVGYSFRLSLNSSWDRSASRRAKRGVLAAATKGVPGQLLISVRFQVDMKMKRHTVLRRAPCERPEMSEGGLILGIEIELNLHVVGIAEKNVPAGTVQHLVHAIGHALVGKVPLHRLEAMAAESDMIDDARIGSLLLASLRVVVEMQDRMARWRSTTPPTTMARSAR